MQSDYFRELTRNLQQEGFAVCPEEKGLLPVEVDGQRLCLITGSGGIRYWKEDITDDGRKGALDRASAIAKVTNQYMRQIEAAPHLEASGLKGDYRLLADFNGIALAGHPTEYGAQFVTWEWGYDKTSLGNGHYYGPACGVDGYIAAKQDFATRSDLIPQSALFAPEQLAEIYRSIHETLESTCPMTAERQKCLEQAVSQIERTVPDLEMRIALSKQKELEAGMTQEMGL